MPCKHQKYTATRLSGIFVFASPYKYDTSDLVQALEDSLNPSGDEFKSLREDILYSIKNHTDQTFLRKMDDNDPERLSLKSLDLIFSTFNAYFFKNTLPQDTRVVRKTENNSSITAGFFLPFKAASSSGIFAAATRIFHSSTPEIDHTKSPNIIIPSKGTSSTKSSPGDDVSALLEAMIAFYLQWYSCRKPSCLNRITACGKGPRGYAWQKIANLLERSEMMSDMQTLIGSQVRLRRYEEFVRELSYWDKPRLFVSLDLLRELGLVAWTVEDFVYAAEEEQRKTIASAVKRMKR
ncbi:uncharacterized protein EAE97_006598 [Botrytis byssoidea]|uniref:Uncharacterized protein n=1 Tax=Botrytis byssoidea TaxID=139641 RepID=A0A9P5LYN3_9HELO|nr:uncharacterized protein EAE97_006598 [Botrytis byssoidea]KAF7941761.1 hypothetical protein EAE97_006598 [Botrytis byssoidea]